VGACLRRRHCKQYNLETGLCQPDAHGAPASPAGGTSGAPAISRDAGKTQGFAVSGKMVSGKMVSGKMVSGKTVSGKTVSGKTVRRKTVTIRYLRDPATVITG
jgi:hypothetical protein